jgi:hypothetical protein
MKASLSTKLTQLAARLHELDGLLAAEDVTRDLDRFRALSREHSEITPVVTLYRDWQGADNDLAAAQDMLADPEMKAFGDEEAKAAKARMEALEAQLQSVLLPRDPNDERNIFVEIRAGTGGDESALFAGDLLRMYVRFAERNKWKVELISEAPGTWRLQGGDRASLVRMCTRSSSSSPVGIVCNACLRRSRKGASIRPPALLPCCPRRIRSPTSPSIRQRYGSTRFAHRAPVANTSTKRILRFASRTCRRGWWSSAKTTVRNIGIARRQWPSLPLGCSTVSGRSASKRKPRRARA